MQDNGKGVMYMDTGRPVTHMRAHMCSGIRYKSRPLPIAVAINTQGRVLRCLPSAAPSCCETRCVDCEVYTRMINI